METPITKQLKQLQMNMPIADQAAENRRRAAQTLQMQQLGQQVVNQPAATPIPQAVSAVTQQVAQTGGQQQIQQAQNQAQQVGQLAQIGQYENQTANAVANATANRNLNAQQFSGEAALSRLSENAKQQLFDSRLALVNEQNSNKFLNDTQMMDLALLRGIDDEKFRDYQQVAEQTSQRKLQLLEAAHNRIQFEMEQAHNRGEQQLDQSLGIRLAQLKAAMQEEAQRKQNRAAGLGALIKGGLTVIGALVAGPKGGLIGHGVATAITE